MYVHIVKGNKYILNRKSYCLAIKRIFIKSTKRIGLNIVLVLVLIDWYIRRNIHHFLPFTNYQLKYVYSTRHNTCTMTSVNEFNSIGCESKAVLFEYYHP